MPLNRYRALEALPEFATMPWERQQTLRAAVLSKDLPETPEFSQLPPEAQQQLFQKLVLAPPKFSDPTVSARVQQTVAADDKDYMQGRTFWQSAFNNMSMMNLFNRGIGRLFDLMGMETEAGVARSWDNPDARKEAAYYSTVLNADISRARAAQAAATWGSMIGAGIDIAAYNHLFVGSLQAPKSLTAAAINGMKTLGQRATTNGALALSRMGVGAVHAMGEGVAGLIRQNVKENLESLTGKPKYQLTLLQSAKTFGDYFLGDLAFFSLGGVLKYTVNSGKFITGLARRGEAFSLGDLNTYWKQALSFDDINIGQFARLPVRAQRLIANTRRFAQVMNNVEDMTPEDVFTAVALHDGFNVTRDGAKYTIESIVYDNVSTTVEGLEPAMRWVASTSKRLGTRREGSEAILNSLRAGKSSQISSILEGTATETHTQDWVQMASKKLGFKIDEIEGTIRIDDPIRFGTPSFSSWDDAGQFIVANTTNVGAVRRHLKTLGLTITEGSDGKVFVKDGSKVVAQGASVSEVLQAYPDFTPKISSALAPDLSIIDEGAHRIRYRSTIAEGTYQDLLKDLSKYSDDIGEATETTITAQGGKTIALNRLTKRYEVFIPEINHRKVFTTLDEAKQYLESGWKDLDGLETAAFKKGFRLAPAKDKWVLYDGTGREFVIDNLEDAYKTLAEVPTPSYMKELSGIDPTLLSGTRAPDVGEVVGELSESASPVETASLGLIARYTFAPTDRFFVQAAKEGAPEDVLKLFREAEGLRDLVTGRNYTLFQGIDAAFRGVDGRMPKRAVRVKLGHLLEVPEEQWPKLIKAYGLSEPQVDIARRLRTFFGESKDQGLFKHFGVSPKEFIEDYLPRLRKSAHANQELLARLTDGEVDEFMKRSFDGNPPHGLSAWFKHDRTSEIARYARERDPLVIMQRYIAVGNKEMLLGPTLDKMEEFLKSPAGKNLDPFVRQRSLAYMQDIMGMPTRGEAQLRVVTEKFFNALSKAPVIGPYFKNHAFSGDFVDMIKSWGYFSGMAFRPWLPVRNALQPLTTVAPRIGVHWLTDALDVMTKDKKGALYQRLFTQGFLTATHGVQGGDVLSDIPLGKVLETGLAWYRNSDDFTRVWTYLAGELKFDDAAQRLRRGLINLEGFRKMSGIMEMDDDLQKQALTLFAAGRTGEAAAKDLFARDLVAQGLYLYRKGEGPMIFRGVVGKAFGQFGTYGVYYTRNIMQALGRRTLGEKLTYAATAAATGYGLYHGFKAIGIEARNFKPLSPMALTGGPYYQIANKMLLATGRNYAARQARGQLTGISEKDGKLSWDFDSFWKSDLGQWMNPSALAMRAISKSWDFMQTGDYYKASLALSSAPLLE